MKAKTLILFGLLCLVLGSDIISVLDFYFLPIHFFWHCISVVLIFVLTIQVIHCYLKLKNMSKQENNPNEIILNEFVILNGEEVFVFKLTQPVEEGPLWAELGNGKIVVVKSLTFK